MLSGKNKVLEVERDFFHNQRKFNERIINCLEIDLTDEILGSSSDVSVFSYKISISGKVSLPGKNILIYCREIYADTDAEINVSGNPVKNFNFRASDGPGPGRSGSDGETGKQGKNAGNITIIAERIIGQLKFTANGGDGGNGQNAGHGQQGMFGPNGLDASDQHCHGKYNGELGQNGKRGGDGGRGGQGGRGGNSGNINLWILENVDEGQIQFKSDAGNGGKPGKSGNFGKGGLGGTGGYNKKCRSRGPDRYEAFSLVSETLLSKEKKSFYGGFQIQEFSTHTVSMENESIDEDTLSEINDVENVIPITSIDDIDVIEPFARGMCSCSNDGKQPDGPKGSDGKSPHSFPSGKRGIDNYGLPADYTEIIKKINIEEIGKWCSPSQVSMILHRARIHYLNEEFESVYELLSWILNITKTRSMDIINIPSHRRGGTFHDSLPNHEEWQSVRLEAIILLSRLSSGLDFFGYKRNFVPLIDLDSVKDFVEKFIEIAKNIESSYRKYWEEERGSKRKLEFFKEGVYQAKNSLNLLDIKYVELEQMSNETQDVIINLTSAMEKQIQLLTGSGDGSLDKFQKAVLKKLNRSACSQMAEVFKFIRSVAAVSGTMYNNINNILLSDISTSETDELNLKGVVKFVKTISGTIDDTINGYREIRNLINDDGDSAKLIIDMDNINDQIEPYMMLGEAQQYKREVKRLFALAKSRNEKLLEYTSILTNMKKIDINRRGLLAEIDRLEDIVADSQDPELVEIVNFMGNLLRFSKNFVIEALYLEHRAFEYWSMRTDNFKVDDRDIAALEFVHLSTLDRVSKQRVYRNRPEQEFDVSRIIEINEDTVSRDTMNKFRESGVMHFEIPADHHAFNTMAGVTVYAVEVEVEGVRTSDKRLRLSLNHLGLAHFHTQDNKIVTFTHRPRLTNLEYDIRTNQQYIKIQGNLGGVKGKYAYLSPIGNWTIYVRDIRNHDLDRSRVKSIYLKFKGYFLPLI